MALRFLLFDGKKHCLPQSGTASVYSGPLLPALAALLPRVITFLVERVEIPRAQKAILGPLRGL